MTDKRYYTELITLYFDGEITREEEQILFKALADEPLLQAEFHRARRIDSLLKISPANVPLELDNAVLNRVGIRNRERRGLAILWNTVTPAQALRYAAAIGFFISSGMLVWYSSLHNRPENSTASVSEIKTPMLHKFDDANRKNPVSQYHAIPTPEKDKQLEGITLYSDHRHVGGQSVFANHLPTGKSQTIEHKRNQLDNTLLTRSEGVPENIEQVTELAQQPASFVLPEAVINPSITALRESQIPALRSTPQNILVTQNMQQEDSPVITTRSYAVEARGIQNVVQPSSAGQPTMSVAGMYRVSESDWVGVTLGSQNFALNTVTVIPGAKSNTSEVTDPGNAPFNRNAKDSVVNFTATSHNVWYGAMYEKRFGTKDNIVKPTARVTLGVFGVHPMGRLNTGVLYSITESVHASGGVEGTLFLNTQNQEWSSSGILSGVLGVVVEL